MLRGVNRDATALEPALDQEPEGLDSSMPEIAGFPIDNLMIRAEARSVFEVVRRIDSGHYIMDPDFQRDFVWEPERQSKLIESAVLRVPLPVFYLAETRDGKVVVVDGLQRLTTFHRFLKGRFALEHLSLAAEFNTRRFADLPPVLQNRIEETPLTLYLIDSKVPEPAKYEIFERVNSGMPLTRQQMRNCLFAGEATRWLARMTDDPDFQRATRGGLNPKTMRDRECVNRYAAFRLFGCQEYDGRMEHFLNEALRKMNKEFGPGDYAEMSAGFRAGMAANHRLFGAHAFRKSLLNPGAGGRSVVNVALFDVFSVQLADLSPDQTAARGPDIVAGVRNLLRDDGFDEAISRSTNSARNVRHRFDRAREMLQKTLP
jgi:hypothetical protein